jgi:murein DD-endopeptidase MepM/ murein hydrolase activator NlpD
MSMPREKVDIFEIFGLNPLDKALKDSKKALFGDEKIPPSQFDLSSLNICKPQISLPAWLGIYRKDRRIPIYNFFNRVNPPTEHEVYSVKVTYARDYLGGKWTYDSHQGVDFALPPGTPVTTCAPGKVLMIVSQLDSGGLKVFIDHGEGLATSYAHLSRALVREGDIVGRGQTIALSGAAGIEMIVSFPWVAPHLHLCILLNGAPVDPFAKKGETSLWRGGNDPAPYSGPDDFDFTPTAWNEHLMEEFISRCTNTEERNYLKSIENIDKRAAEIFNYRMFYNTLFTSFSSIYDEEYERRSVLDLPFKAEDFDGVLFP